MLFDTTFLIDLHREARRREPGRAFRFLETHPDVPTRISIVTYGEFAEGFLPEQRQQCTELLRPYYVLALSEEIAWRYGQLSGALRQAGEAIGDNDLWIAATAVHHAIELVTRNASHFKRVRDLRVVEY